MLVRSLLIGLACLVIACSDDAEPASTAPNPPQELPSGPSPAEVTRAPEEAPEIAMVPGTLRLVVLRPETLLGREERTMTRFMEALDDTDLQVLHDEPSDVERNALTTFFGGGEWTRPAEWAQHDVVLALEFIEPAMLGQREERPYSQGLRTAALWAAGDEQPAYLQQSRLTPVSAIGRLATPRDVSGFLVQLSLDARSGS